MCVRFPNWEHRTLSLGEVGYLSYKVIIAGVDQWFDGNDLKYYRYSMVQFIKFVSRPVSKKHSYTLQIILKRRSILWKIYFIIKL